MEETDIFAKAKRYDPKKIPEVVTIPVVIWYTISGYDAGKIGVYSFDFRGDEDTIVLDKKEIEVSLNISKDIRQVAIDCLNQSIKDVQAEAFKKVSRIQERINALTQLTYSPEVLIDEEVSFSSDEIPF